MSTASNHNLPGLITSISPQKKNKERYSVFVNGDYLIGVSESTLIDFNLAKGVEMTPLLFQRLQRAEGRHAVKSYALKLLGRRDHARKELLTKARRKDYPPELIHDVLDELQHKGFINDRTFAEKFAADKSRLNKWGPIKIRSHLIQKGINDADISHGINQAFGDVDLKETFLNLVLKKKRRFLREDDLLKRKKKVLDYLSRKGYKSGTIFKHLDELMEAISE